MFIEGPIVAYISSFAAALGYFNVWILIPLFILGNQIPDILIFKIGGLLRGKTVEKYVSYFGLHKKRIKWLEKNINKHSIKTIILIKSVPPLPLPGIIISGFMKMPFKKFFWIDLIYNIFYAILFITLGYYSGLVTNMSLKYFKLGEYILPIAVILTIIVYILIRRVSAAIVKNKKS
jgi:membrane-associated protein